MAVVVQPTDFTLPITAMYLSGPPGTPPRHPLWDVPTGRRGAVVIKQKGVSVDGRTTPGPVRVGLPPAEMRGQIGNGPFCS